MGLSVNITAGVWLCSYMVRVCASAGVATTSGFNAYMSATGTAGVSPAIVAYTALQFSANGVANSIATIGNNNLSLSGTGVITSTTTQTINLITFIDINSGTIIYLNGNYIMATRIA